MPLFQKGSLNSIINQRPLRPSEIIKYSIDFLSGLHHIHSKRLVHCDIKPTNLLVTDNDDAILTDFGLARYLNDDGLTVIDKFYHFHRAPETIQSNIISHHSDIFQAGLTIYRLCNGNNFFKSQLNKFNSNKGFNYDKFIKAIFEGKFPDRSAYLHHIPQTLRNAIRKALQPNPNDRYNYILDFLNDLANIEIEFDWQMYSKAEGFDWVCTKDEKEYIISLVNNNNSEIEVKSTKRILNGAKERKITDYCKKNTTLDEAYSLIKKALANKSL
jgi:serine/threonine protein kinase